MRALLILLVVAPLLAVDYRGQVTYGGLPLPGATVTATREGQNLLAVTGTDGTYVFTDLPAGAWRLQVAMQCFATVAHDVTVGDNHPAPNWELHLLPLEEITSTATRVAVLPQPAPPPPSETAAKSSDDTAAQAVDGLLVNGTENNGASTPFALAAAFGNSRQNTSNLLTGGIGVILENSALDARPFSLTGQDTSKPSYNHVRAVATLGGVMKIPHIMPRGPNFFAGYQWTRNRDAATLTGLMPDAQMRDGQFSAPAQVFDVPQSRISPQAKALLNLYPLPNFTGSSRYNYQVSTVSAVHQDAFQSRLNKTINNHNQVYGGFAYESSRSDTPNLFGFLDTSGTTGIDTNINWQHAFRSRLYGKLEYTFSRLGTRSQPFFQNRQNVSGDAGIAGNDQEPVNWGPPSLTFSSGITPLSDAQAFSNHNQTSALSPSIFWNRGRHNLTLGGDFRRQQFNYLAQQDPRGSFTFTGAASGYDLADFLLGTPDTSSIAFGNADKYFRTSSYAAYINDDLRIGSQFTLNAGLRWEYGAPITELYGRLVNLDVSPGFAAVAPVTALHSRDSLIDPDKHGIQPRIGIAWRPVSGSSLVVRAGYGVEYNTSVYQTIALQMAQQAPLSKSFSVQNSSANPLTLANGFNVSPLNTPATFGIDPQFRVGYVQNWKLTVQRDFPGSMIVTATYLGIKGTRGVQQFLPNTYPAGATDPCLACPRGFAYMASNGNSTRQSGQVQLRRRLHNGLTATAQYTYSKSIDNSALGGRGQATAVIAQNWLDLDAERGLSSFDQRHLLNAQFQYTTGMGLGGGALLSGWQGALFKEWTVATQITAGSGFPLTPIYLAAVAGTGVTGSIRPDYTGEPVYTGPSGLFLNPEAYLPPAPGQWGDAGRNTITGPSQLAINVSLGRTLRVRDRFHLDLRFDSTNALNHVTYTTWNTIVTSAQFGVPVAANAMRDIETSLRLRF